MTINGSLKDAVSLDMIIKQACTPAHVHTHTHALCKRVHVMYQFMLTSLVQFYYKVRDMHYNLQVHKLTFYTAEEESSKPRSAAPSSDRDWLSQVEILTYAPPSRRLWMGPQFSFKAYSSSSFMNPSGDLSFAAPASSSSAVLHTPSPPNTIIYSSSLNSPTGVGGGRTAFKVGLGPSSSQGSLELGRKVGTATLRGLEGEEGEQDVSLQTAMLFPSPDNTLMDLLSDPPDTQSLTLTSPHSDSQSLATLSTGKESTTEGGNSDRGNENEIIVHVHCVVTL